MKIVLLLGLVLAFGFCGFQIKQALHKRYLFYQDVCSFIDDFIVNVNFSQESFNEFIKNRKTKNVELDKVLKSYLNFDCAKQKIYYIQDDKLSEVYEMLDGIGRTDSENQIAILNNYKTRFEKHRQQAEEVDKKYSSLTIKISLLVGVLVDIILI